MSAKPKNHPPSSSSSSAPTPAPEAAPVTTEEATPAAPAADDRAAALEARIAELGYQLEAAIGRAADIEESVTSLGTLLDAANARNDELTRRLAAIDAAGPQAMQEAFDNGYQKAIGESQAAVTARLAQLQLFNVDRTSGRFTVAATSLAEAIAIAQGRVPETKDDRIRGVASAGIPLVF